MKSEAFSGFDALHAGDELKIRILRRMETEEAGAHRKAARKQRFLAVCCTVVFLLGAAAVFRFYPLAGRSAVFGRGTHYAVLSYPPSDSGLLSYGSAFSLSVPPTEEQTYASADSVVYGTVTAFRWVEFQQASEPLTRCRTIVTVKLNAVYRGDLKEGKSVDILLPFAVSGTGTGMMVEDNENACTLKKGSEAFFFLRQFGSGDRIGDSSWNLRTSEICLYGVDWGNEHILPVSGGSFSYPFAPDEKFTFAQMQALIERKLQQFPR